MKPAVLRPLLHASTALTLLLTLWSWDVFRWALTAGALLGLGLEAARLRVPRFHAWLAGLVPVFRPAETSRVSGAAWLGVGCAAAAWLPGPAAGAAVLTVALADPAGALVGGWLGATPAKSWPGTAAVWVTATAGLAVVGLPWLAVLAGGVVAAAVERWSAPVNDNLAIPLAVGAVVWVLTR